MAIYHFDAQIISRSQGRSAVASAAYRAGEKLHDEREDKTHDYTKKQDVMHTEILLPENAPTWMGERQKLWNAVEVAEKRKDAQLAREIQVSLPRALTLEQNKELVREFVQKEFVSKGMVADVAIHIDKASDGEAQPHAHIMLTLREIKDGEFGPKVREWNQRDNLLEWREAWANTANRHLALHGFDLRIDHRSYQEQGIELEPQHKIGASVVQERKARFADHQRIARENGEKIYHDPKIALNAMTRQQSTFTHQDLARFVNRHTIDAEQFQRVYTAIRASKELVVLGKDDKGRERLTTQEMLTLETRLMNQAEQLKDKPQHAVSMLTSLETRIDKPLSAEQKAALEHLTERGDLKCVVGYAGTGKSHLLGIAREAWDANGYHVRGATLSGIAAENLEASSGIQSRTVASQLKAWEHGFSPLTAKDVLVVDEAGMLGSRQMARLIEEADKSGAKVVLIGDPEQLQAIEAGAAFRAIAEHTGYVELTDIRRQREVWQQEATKEFATGQTAAAFNRYTEHGHVHAFDTDVRAKAALLEQWNEVRLNQPDKTQIVLTYTRADARALNDAARQLRQANQELGEDRLIKTATGERNFAEHDRVYFLRNDKELGVKNGTLGIIERIRDNQLTVRLDHDDRLSHRPERVTVDLERYNHLDHGYVATIHKAQGVTVDRSYILTSPYMDRHAMYVAGSRHRESTDIFYSQESFKNERALIDILSRERAKDMTLDYSRDPVHTYSERRGVTPESLLDQTVPPQDYTQARETFNQDKERQQSALERLQARHEARALQTAHQQLEKEYGKTVSHDWQHGDQGIYRQTVEAGSQRYGVIEQENSVKLIPYEKGMEAYQGRAVTVHREQETGKGDTRATLHVNRERNIDGKERGGDFEISR